MRVEEINEIRKLYELKNISDEEILPYIEMAVDELNEINVKDGSETKAIAYMTLKLLGQKLWHKIQQRANEYDETIETFKDVEKWEKYWEQRLSAITTKKTSFSNFTLGAV